jgi:hypothetical protein
MKGKKSGKKGRRYGLFLQNLYWKERGCYAAYFPHRRSHGGREVVQRVRKERACPVNNR